MRFTALLPIAAACLAVPLASAQQTVHDASALGGSGPANLAGLPDHTIASVPIEGVSLSGSLSVANGRAMIGNNGTITAGERTAHVALTRGGSLNVCASTKIHLTTDSSTQASGNAGALMIALDRGALEAHYATGHYSDVLLTPDLSILISPPGDADLSLRVNKQGDTCLDNHGEHAPYVIVSNLFEGGAYRVQPNQRVLFEKGSLKQVVDNETEPCGCPPDVPVSIASTGAPGPVVARPGEKVSKPSRTEVENPFPLAESEGLRPPPPAPSKPVVPPGTAHAQVEVPLTYDSANPVLPAEPAAPTPEPAARSITSEPQETAVAQAPPPKPHAGVFRHIGRFFKRLFVGK